MILFMPNREVYEKQMVLRREIFHSSFKVEWEAVNSICKF